MTRREEAATVDALTGPVLPLADVRFNLHDERAKSWLYAMIPCPTQGFTMYDYLRVETDDARRRGLSERYSVIQKRDVVGVGRYMTKADGSLIPGSPKFVMFLYTFDFPWSDLQAQVPANVQAEDPIGHVIKNMGPVCQQLRDGLARNLIHSHMTY